jgi:hypothetical protein
LKYWVIFKLLQSNGRKIQCIQRAPANISAAPSKAAGNNHHAGTMPEADALAELDSKGEGAVEVDDCGPGVWLVSMAVVLTFSWGDNSF